MNDEVEKLRLHLALATEALERITNWLAEDRLKTWPYMENPGGFYDDRDKQLRLALEAIAELIKPFSP